MAPVRILNGILLNFVIVLVEFNIWEKMQIQRKLDCVVKIGWTDSCFRITDGSIFFVNLTI